MSVKADVPTKKAESRKRSRSPAATKDTSSKCARNDDGKDAKVEKQGTDEHGRQMFKVGKLNATIRDVSKDPVDDFVGDVMKMLYDIESKRGAAFYKQLLRAVGRSVHEEYQNVSHSSSFMLYGKEWYDRVSSDEDNDEEDEENDDEDEKTSNASASAASTTDCGEQGRRLKQRECIKTTLATFMAKCKALPNEIIAPKVRNTECFDAIFKVAEDMTGLDDTKTPRILRLSSFAEDTTSIPESEWPREILLCVFRDYNDMLENDAADFWDDTHGCLEEFCNLCEQHL